jgi:hypothetical protein
VPRELTTRRLDPCPSGASPTLVARFPAVIAFPPLQISVHPWGQSSELPFPVIGFRQCKIRSGHGSDRPLVEFITGKRSAQFRFLEAASSHRVRIAPSRG